MRGIILAAGYGTRLGDLGKDTPKALLPLGGHHVIDFLLGKLSRIGLDSVCIVTNGRFEEKFRRWLQEASPPMTVELLSDGSGSPEERLGAVKDLRLALVISPSGEDLFVTASDNVYTGEFGVLIQRYRETKAPVVAVMREQNKAVLKRSGVARIDNEGRVVSFVEKPSRPESCYASAPLYVYPPGIIDDIEEFLATPSWDHDAPGNFVSFLVERKEVYGAVMGGIRYDIGSLESYQEAKRALESAGK